MFLFTTAIVMQSLVFPTKPNVNTFKYYGDLPPVNYFDPLNINSGVDIKEEKIKYYREAELQHGRAAMLGAIALPALELMNPNMLSINYLSNLDLMMQSPFWSSMFLYECTRLFTAYENPFVKNGKFFTLKKDYQPGDLLNLKSTNITKERYNRELSNGRLAMLACGHIIGSELVTQQGLF